MSIDNEFFKYRIDPPGLDPVAVYVERFRPGASRITVQCHARAWTAFWGAHGEQPVEQFIIGADVDYVVDNLIWGISHVISRRGEDYERRYLKKIVAAIKVAFTDSPCLERI